MDLKVAISLIKKFIEIEMSSKGDKKPGVSFIVHNVLRSPYLKGLSSKLSANEIIKISYIVFYLFQGDSYEEAEFKSRPENLYLVSFVNLTDKTDRPEECDECVGQGYKDCDECDSGGEVECYQCDGTGQIETSDGMEDCDECNGRGEHTCNYCDGEGRVDCDACDGDGEVKSEEEYFTRTVTNFIFADTNVFEKLSELYNDNEYKYDDEIIGILDEEEIKGSSLLVPEAYSLSDIEEYEIYNRFDFNIGPDDSYIDNISTLKSYEQQFVRDSGNSNILLLVNNRD